MKDLIPFFFWWASMCAIGFYCRWDSGLLIEAWRVVAALGLGFIGAAAVAMPWGQDDARGADVAEVRS